MRARVGRVGAAVRDFAVGVWEEIPNVLGSAVGVAAMVAVGVIGAALLIAFWPELR